jgi:hypothetical protein
MTRRKQDDLILGCIAFGLLLALVAFLKVMLSPMVAAFVAGLGIGAIGVFSLMRRTRQVKASPVRSD